MHEENTIFENTIIKKVSLIVLMIMMTCIVSAQESQIITSKLDTLYGNVTILFGDQYTSDAIYVKLDKRKKVMASEIKSIFFESRDVLHVIKMDGRYQLVKLIHDGLYLKLYTYNAPAYGSKGGFEYEVISKFYGGVTKITNIEFKDKIVGFLSDCPNVTDKVENGTYRRKDIRTIIDEYNECIDDKSNVSQMERTAEIRATKMDDLIDKVSSTKIEGKEELKDMLIDVKSKMATQKEIPGYLEDAIVKMLGKNTELVSQFKSIISSNRF